MSRLSRVRLPPWTVVIAVILFAAIQTFSVYLFLLNRRISRELVDRRWAEPTIIRSAAAVGPGDHVRVTLHEGELDCEVRRTDIAR